MKNLYVSILAIATLLSFSVPVTAVTLSFVPENQTKLLGETAIVDVVVEGLIGNPDEIVSAFDLSLLYDPAILQAGSVTFSAVPLMGGLSDTLWDATFTQGQIDFSVLSLLTDDNAIAALQVGNNNPFALARISFQTIGLGTSGLSFDFTSPTKVIDGRNAIELPISAQNGSITVVGDGTVLEPSTYLLLVIGIIALTFRERGNLRFRYLS